jgi:two-component system response regulator MprA
VDGPRILVVDDNPAMRELLVATLVEGGYAVRGVADGLAALAILDGWAPDLVVTDVRMPGLDGPGLLAAIRARRWCLPVVLTSTVWPDPPVVGAPFVPKPVDVPEFLALVDRLVACTTIAGADAGR